MALKRALSQSAVVGEREQRRRSDSWWRLRKRRSSRSIRFERYSRPSCSRRSHTAARGGCSSLRATAPLALCGDVVTCEYLLCSETAYYGKDLVKEIIHDTYKLKSRKELFVSVEDTYMGQLVYHGAKAELTIGTCSQSAR